MSEETWEYELMADSATVPPNPHYHCDTLDTTPCPTGQHRNGRYGRCEQYARKGTGYGTCNRPLDEHGNCDRAADHVPDYPEPRPHHSVTNPNERTGIYLGERRDV